MFLLGVLLCADVCLASTDNAVFADENMLLQVVIDDDLKIPWRELYGVVASLSTHLTGIMSSRTSTNTIRLDDPMLVDRDEDIVHTNRAHSGTHQQRRAKYVVKSTYEQFVQTVGENVLHLATSETRQFFMQKEFLIKLERQISSATESDVPLQDMMSEMLALVATAPSFPNHDNSLSKIQLEDLGVSLVNVVWSHIAQASPEDMLGLFEKTLSKKLTEFGYTSKELNSAPENPFYQFLLQLLKLFLQLIGQYDGIVDMFFDEATAIDIGTCGADITPGNFDQFYTKKSASDNISDYPTGGSYRICQPLIDNGWEKAAQIPAANNANLGFTEITFSSRADPVDGSTALIKGFYLDQTAADQPTIIVVHGVGMNMRNHDPMSEAGRFRMMGFNVLLFDIRNHGTSEVTNSLNVWSHYELSDLLGAIDCLTTNCGGQMGETKSLDKIGIHGHSGGGYYAIGGFGSTPGIKALSVDTPVFDVSMMGPAGVQRLFPTMDATTVNLMADLFQPPVVEKMESHGYSSDYTPEKLLLPNDSGRKIFLTYTGKDNRVPENIPKAFSKDAVDKKYDVEEWVLTEVKEYDDPKCDEGGEAWWWHCDQKYAAPDTWNSKLCTFWTGIFSVSDAACGGAV